MPIKTASLACRAADLVLIPCRPSTFDLEAIETTLLLAKVANNPCLCEVMNAVPPQKCDRQRGVGRVDRARRAKVAPHQLTHRAAFSHGVIDGRSAQEFETKR